EPPEILWRPTAAAVESSNLTTYIDHLRARGVDVAAYPELWRWSVEDLEGFWNSILDHFGVEYDGERTVALASRAMPGAEWFPGLRLNWAERAFAGRDEDAVAILHASELRDLEEITWGALRARVAACAAGLRSLGVGPGDRVVAYLPNVAEAAIAFLATASIGAIWSAASPDFGAGSLIDRFAQIGPKVLIAVDGYRYGGRDFDRIPVVRELQEAMPGLAHTVLLPYLDPAAGAAAGAAGLRDVVGWEELLARGADAPPGFARVPFAHPLWVLYSSGTTGLPKAIVQGQGGILLEQLKKMHLHTDARPGDRLFWFTTTGWMMWNFIVSGLLTEAAIVLYDGNPGHPDMGALWDLAERAGITTFGTSAAYISACMKAGVEPSEGRDLSRLRSVGSTGSPLAPEGFDWIYEHVGRDTWLFSTSGGTDLCTAFVGGVPTLPVYRGELQARCLGAAVESWDPDGHPHVGRVGELVITEPMPSMPLFLWGDADGSRYRESYFEMFPGVWRHGDWIEITERGTAIIYGRSDSTINRGGIRIGTAEIYRAVLASEDVVDALV
ncbi:MAG TPA: acetoacetate--CoA ligase, partial [Solirubrobacterales bacterium]|nr:acetoacetate--CoA ligase [Solirubrobacterales bacterium]